MTKHPAEQPKEKPIELILKATTLLCANKCLTSLSHPETWPSTREIAEFCDMDIYRARYWLLKLLDLGLIDTQERSINNTLRWRVSTTIKSEVE